MTMPQSSLVASQSVDHATFEGLYAGPAPWDIGKPQGAFVAIADRVTGPVLDAGCGTGEHALFFAARGLRVIGIDFVEEAIRRARAKAAERGQAVEFLVKDATALDGWGERFASVIDCGLFHVFSDDDRRRYVRGLAQVLEPGGRLFLMCFSDEEPGIEGPRRVSRQELYAAFADGWEVESVQPVQIEIHPEFTEGQILGGWAEGVVRGRPSEGVSPAAGPARAFSSEAKDNDATPFPVFAPASAGITRQRPAGRRPGKQADPQRGLLHHRRDAGLQSQSPGEDHQRRECIPHAHQRPPQG